MGAKFALAQAICSDSWVVNLRTTYKESENLLMDVFVKGLRDIKEELTKEWEGKTPEKPKVNKMYELNMTSELQDLHKVYKDAVTMVNSRQSSNLRHMVDTMRRFIEGYDEQEKYTQKLAELEKKLAIMEGKPCDPHANCCQGDDK